MSDSLYGGRRPQLLAVDDDNMNLRMISRAFEAEADVTTALSGPEAISWLASHEADLVMLDYRMPVMDGFDVLRILKGRGITTLRDLCSRSRDDLLAIRFLGESNVDTIERLLNTFDLKLK